MSRITGITKRDTRTVVIFTKDNRFYRSFKKMLMEMGFDEWDVPSWCPPTEDQPSLDVVGLNDHYVSGSSKGLHVDLILGKERVFIIAQGPDLEKFNQAVAKHFSF